MLAGASPRASRQLLQKYASPSTAGSVWAFGIGNGNPGVYALLYFCKATDEFFVAFTSLKHKRIVTIYNEEMVAKRPGFALLKKLAKTLAR